MPDKPTLTPNTRNSQPTPPSEGAPYGSCPVCGLPLIYSPTRRLLICGDDLCKYCTPFTESNAKTTEDILASRFLTDCAIEELYPQYKKS